MPVVKNTCCGTELLNANNEEMEIPRIIREELEQRGGFDVLVNSVPPLRDLEKRTRTHLALSDPIRLTILHLLAVQPLCVCVIKACIRIADSKLSYHLTILKKAGLIEGEPQGNWIIYRLTEKGKKFVKETA
ncbi:MAG: metalloregulator ArsR/SmtB family transcription factor [Methanoregula sp.]|nr:metalloregulator ArsR/SmtB family transcription factor [Methanoregula sp.]